MCQNYKSETGCKFGRTCFFRHVEADEKPSKKSKKCGAKGSVALLKESTQLGCVSQDSYPRKSIPLEKGKLEPKHAVKFSKGTWHQIKIREERVHREELFKSVNLMSVVLARQNSGKDHLQERCARRVALDLAKICTSSRMRTKLRFMLLLKQR